MDLNKIVYNYEIDGEPFVMAFDMRSIAVYKTLTGFSFLESSKNIGELDDAIILGFIAATLRRNTADEDPLAEEIYNYNLINLLFTFHNDVIQMVLDSMPQNTQKVKKKIQ